MLERPLKGEYNPYYERYIRLVPDGDLIEVLIQLREGTAELMAKLSEAQGDYRYAPDKWSLKEVIGHINDTERIMSYRLLRVARGDKTPLPGFDEDDFVRGAFFSSSNVSDLIEDYIAVRQASLTLFRGLPAEAWLRTGIVNHNETSARALAYIIAGHELHHVNVIKERYLI